MKSNEKKEQGQKIVGCPRCYGKVIMYRRKTNTSYCRRCGWEGLPEITLIQNQNPKSVEEADQRYASGKLEERYGPVSDNALDILESARDALLGKKGD